MKKTHLKSKEISRELGINLNKKDTVELWENEQKLIVINETPSFFYYNDKTVPTLKYLQKHEILKKITVDMGAVKFVVNGADIMRPGITEIGEGITEKEFIVVVDINNKKPLAVGIALFSSAEMKAKNSGKVIKNIHYVGDELWDL